MADFTMPALGADMESGKVVEWLVQAGDRVKPGDVVAVVETHKGAIDVECFLDGIVADLAPVGVDLPVGAVLAHVRGAGDAAAPATVVTAVPVPAAPVAAAPKPPAASAPVTPPAPVAPAAVPAPSAPG